MATVYPPGNMYPLANNAIFMGPHSTGGQIISFAALPTFEGMRYDPVEVFIEEAGCKIACLKALYGQKLGQLELAEWVALALEGRALKKFKRWVEHLPDEDYTAESILGFLRDHFLVYQQIPGSTQELPAVHQSECRAPSSAPVTEEEDGDWGVLYKQQEVTVPASSMPPQCHPETVDPMVQDAEV